VLPILTAASRGGTEPDPVGSSVGRAGKLLSLDEGLNQNNRLDEGLNQNNRAAIFLLPQDPARQVRNPDKWQDEKTRVVGDQVKVLIGRAPVIMFLM
jgi:hypothetical protein